MKKPDWIDGCSDNQCIIDGPKVGTNGGCSCIDRFMDTMQVNKIRAYVRHLKSYLEDIEKEEVAWLIEKPGGLCLGLGCGKPSWTSPSLALRFSRKEDALAYMDVHVPKITKAEPVEHSWL